MVVDFDTELCDLVVTERRGNYCYIGPPYGPRLEPNGVFTGGLSQILVCDAGINTIHIIYRIGMFLSCLLIYH